MRAELANINQCAVPFLSRAAANLYWYDGTEYRHIPGYNELYWSSRHREQTL